CDRGALAGAVDAQQGSHLAGVQPQVDAVERAGGAIALAGAAQHGEGWCRFHGSCSVVAGPAGIMRRPRGPWQPRTSTHSGDSCQGARALPAASLVLPRPMGPSTRWVTMAAGPRLVQR